MTFKLLFYLLAGASSGMALLSAVHDDYFLR